MDVGGLQLGQQGLGILRAGLLQLALDVGPGVFKNLAAARVFVQRNVVFGKQVLAPLLDEPGHVFGKVFAGFGGEVAELVQHFVAHFVPCRGFAFGIYLVQARIQVYAFVLKLGIERHVVDAGTAVVNLFGRDAQIVRQFVRRVLHAVAQADGGDAGAGLV